MKEVMTLVFALLAFAALVAMLWALDRESQRSERARRERADGLQQEANEWRESVLDLLNRTVDALRESHANALETVTRMQREGFVDLSMQEPEEESEEDEELSESEEAMRSPAPAGIRWTDYA